MVFVEMKSQHEGAMGHLRLKVDVAFTVVWG